MNYCLIGAEYTEPIVSGHPAYTLCSFWALLACTIGFHNSLDSF